MCLRDRVEGRARSGLLVPGKWPLCDPGSCLSPHGGGFDPRPLSSRGPTWPYSPAGAFCIPLYVPYVLTGRWPFSRGLCKLWLVVDYLLCTSSVFNIVLISYDRFLSVTRAVSLGRWCPRSLLGGGVVRKWPRQRTATSQLWAVPGCVVSAGLTPDTGHAVASCPLSGRWLPGGLVPGRAGGMSGPGVGGVPEGTGAIEPPPWSGSRVRRAEGGPGPEAVGGSLPIVCVCTSVCACVHDCAPGSQASASVPISFSWCE